MGGVGVASADGSPLQPDSLQAALLLPMGRFGPAFLAYPNFDVYTNWNKSLVYTTTAAYFATRLAGAPPVQRGSAVALSTRAGEGPRSSTCRGSATMSAASTGRSACRRARRSGKCSIGLGLPADAYPTAEFVAKLAAM